MKKILLFSLMAVFCLGTFAEGNTRKSLTIKQLDGTTFSVDATNFKIEFVEGNLVVEQDGNALTTIPQNTLDEMYFSDDEPTGIEEINNSREQGTGVVYNLQGVQVNENYKGIVLKNGKKFLNK